MSNTSRRAARRAGSVLAAGACVAVLVGQSPAHAARPANAAADATAGTTARTTATAPVTAVTADRLEVPVPSGVPAFQTARNRQVKTRTVNYVRYCPGCVSGKEVPPSFRDQKATARIKMTASTYKILDQNDKYDFYVVDVSSELTKRKGDQDWGWYDATITSVGRTKILGSSYSTGKDVQNVDKCKKFPVNLGVSYYGASVGTTVGHVAFCHKGSRLVRSGVTKGQKYHATGVTGIRSLQSQRYVRVKQGRLPKFKVSLVTNNDRFFCYTVSDGTHCRVDHATQSKSLRIGTTRQKK